MWRIGIPAPWPLGWGNANMCVLHYFLELPLPPSRGHNCLLCWLESYGISDWTASLPCTFHLVSCTSQVNQVPSNLIPEFVPEDVLHTISHGQPFSKEPRKRPVAKHWEVGASQHCGAPACVLSRNFKFSSPLSPTHEALACLKHSEKIRLTQSSGWPHEAARVWSWVP